MKRKTKNSKGFTLLELLVVITILAILMVIVVIFINPVETLRRGRDAQRLSDLRTMKTAISLYLTKTGNNLGGTTNCILNTTTTPLTNGSGTDITKVRASLPCTDSGCTTFPLANANANYTFVNSTNLQNNDGTGWIPLNFTNLTQGPVISNLPIDPVNTASGALYYRYVCKQDDTFEMDGNLESTEYTSTDNKEAKDGGDSNTDSGTTESARYEIGTNLKLLPKYAPEG